MAGVLKPDKLLLCRCDGFVVFPNQRRATEWVLPAFKEKDRRAEVESESSQVKVRQLRKKQVQGQLLAAHESVVIGQRIFRSGDKIQQKSSDVGELRPARTRTQQFRRPLVYDRVLSKVQTGRRIRSDSLQVF